MNKEIQVLLLAHHVAVEEGHDLASGAGIRRGEFGLRGSLGDAVFHGPEDCLVEIVGLADVLEGIHGGSRLRLAFGAPEEGHDLSARAGIADAELRPALAVRDPILNRPEDGLGVVGVSRNVLEGVLR